MIAKTLRRRAFRVRPKFVQTVDNNGDTEGLRERFDEVRGTGHIHAAFMLGRVSVRGPADGFASVRAGVGRSSPCNEVYVVAGVQPGNPDAQCCSHEQFRGGRVYFLCNIL